MSQELVARVKAYLESLRLDLNGPCGAFEITKRVAGNLDLGVLSKPSGNNCEGKAVDQVCWPDGTIRDVLGDAGGANTPQWGEPEQVDPSRFVAVPHWSFPLDPPSPPQEPPSQPSDLTPILARIEALEASQASLAGLVARIMDEFGTGVRVVLAKMSVSGSTNRVWGHAHQIDLKIEEK